MARQQNDKTAFAGNNDAADKGYKKWHLHIFTYIRNTAF